MATQVLIAETDGAEHLSSLLRELFPTEMRSGALAYSRTHGIWHGVVTVTPEIAARILHEFRPDWQRPLNPRGAEKLQRDMANGEWLLNGEPLVFTRAFEQANGQHRTYACAQSGTPFTTLLVAGVTEEAFDLFDQHKARTLGVALKQRGEKDANTLASTIKHLWLYRRGGLYSRVGYPSLREGLQILDEHGDTLRRSVSIGRRAQRKRLPAGLLASLHFACSEKDAGLADWFWERLATGTDLGENTPIHKLYSRLDAISDDEGGRTSEQMIARLIVKAWSATRAGKRMKRLTIQPGENPEIL